MWPEQCGTVKRMGGCMERELKQRVDKDELYIFAPLCWFRAPPSPLFLSPLTPQGSEVIPPPYSHSHRNTHRRQITQWPWNFPCPLFCFGPDSVLFLSGLNSQILIQTVHVGSWWQWLGFHFLLFFFFFFRRGGTISLSLKECFKKHLSWKIKLYNILHYQIYIILNSECCEWSYFAHTERFWSFWLFFQWYDQVGYFICLTELRK